MISGTVNARYEPAILLPVQDAGGQFHDIEFVVDTGFTSTLTLRPAQIAALGLPWRSCDRFGLAGGSVVYLDVYEVTKVGVSFLKGYDFRVRFEVGGPVEIEAIP